MKFVWTFIIFLFGLVGGYAATRYIPSLNQSVIAPTPIPTPVPTPLVRYSFDSLRNYQAPDGKIAIEQETAKTDEVITYLSSFNTGNRTMSMQLMVPQTATPAAGFPIILMYRGYVDPAIYQTGIGTKNAATYFASNGFVTIAPDFLGFGVSDPPPLDTLEARLEKPQQLLDLIQAFSSLSFVNPYNYGFLGHSNGGQIALSMLEITSRPTPTVLWAPVSKPFPYSLLYYTDESDDGGKALRKAIADFETIYDVFDFSLDQYLDRITAPIQIHQGTADDAVPEDWSVGFVELLKEHQVPVTYFTYEGADHNLRPSWDTAVARSLAFFNEYLYFKN